jgi:hypothetical protein
MVFFLAAKLVFEQNVKQLIPHFDILQGGYRWGKNMSGIFFK